MFCKDKKCANINLCKHYEYLCKYPQLSINSCDLCSSKLEPYEQLFQESKTIMENNTMLLSTEISNDYRPDLKGPAFACPACNKDTYDKEVVECALCHEQLCTKCANYGDTEISPDGSLKMTYLCDECYCKEHKHELSTEDAPQDESLLEVLIDSIEHSDTLEVSKDEQ